MFRGSWTHSLVANHRQFFLRRHLDVVDAIFYNTICAAARPPASPALLRAHTLPTRFYATVRRAKRTTTTHSPHAHPQHAPPAYTAPHTLLPATHLSRGLLPPRATFAPRLQANRCGATGESARGQRCHGAYAPFLLAFTATTSRQVGVASLARHLARRARAATGLAIQRCFVHTTFLRQPSHRTFTPPIYLHIHLPTHHYHLAALVAT